ncbi:hypothetical protein [Psychroserpens sp. NJDZ02]|uniref:hypothetical protein n=1 Tax=Psychroserpens sp. NJDZ02 TaxID=2570561 RepID=UPI0010A84CA7|nr:hypothetical protein [Psychroserpens sp. NJDZ02]QCE39926.1 hypothetical protein E9099_00245 [Psychroserpens sp. NJDZ02]
METLIGYSCILVGIICILGVVFFSKQQIGRLIFRASICMAVPILGLWLSFIFLHLNFAEYLLLEIPYSLIFLGTLIILTFIYNGFEMKNILSFLVFLIGFMIIYFGIFTVCIDNMSIGF